MLIYYYDGSFEGLLTSIHEAYYRHENPERILPAKSTQESIFFKSVNILTDPVKSKKVYNAIAEKISWESLEHIYNVYLSELEDASTWIYEYVKLGFKMGNKLDCYLSDDRVLRIIDTSKKVFGERHGLLGLVRFRQIQEDLYYAPIEPKYNVTAILAPHFSKRLSGQNWIIHDVRRRIGAVYNKEEWVLSDIDIDPDSPELNGADFFQSLWRGYFNNIAIKERINPKLQKRCMPVRYWKYLSEMQ
jgi:probable DNA metabolism protein